MTPPDLPHALLGLAAAIAGFVDAVVGGGGLVLVPALLSALPQAAPATLFGTNKSAQIWGTAAAMRVYLRRVELPWSVLAQAIPAAFVGALAGAAAVSAIDPSLLRRALPLLLALVLIWTLRHKQLGQHHNPLPPGRRRTLLALFGGAALGFYDGCFGPGTGSLLMFLFVRGFGFDFLRASAAAKIINVSTNLAALALFATHGHIMLHLAVGLAACNVAGGLLGSRFALRHGSAFVRLMFIAVVTLLIAKSAWVAYFG